MNKEFFNKNKNAIVVVLILFALIVAGFIITRSGGGGGGGSEKESTLPDVEALPTVDPSVIVKLEPDSLGQEVTLTVENAPETTTEIEYELSYDALVDGEPLPKGVIGTMEVSDDLTAEKQITLGTCSSGTCKYDEGVESIHVTLKFVGDYGAQLFEGDFEL